MAVAGGRSSRQEHLENQIAAFDLNGVPITPDDCLEVTAISHRNPPTCYLALELYAGSPYIPTDRKPDYYDAWVRPDQQGGYFPVLYLPARANQITLLALPAAGGPDLMFTDPLTGCKIYTGTVNGQQVVCHANALTLDAANNFQSVHEGSQEPDPGLRENSLAQEGHVSGHRRSAQVGRGKCKGGKETRRRSRNYIPIHHRSWRAGSRSLAAVLPKLRLHPVGSHWHRKNTHGAESQKSRVSLQQFN